MSDVEIFGARQSIYVRVVWMTCEEKGAPYVIRPVAPYAPELAALTPFGRIPVVRHDGAVLYESKAITTYIDRVFEGARLIPDDPLSAARVEQWVSVANTILAPTWVRYFQAYVFPKGPGGQPDRAIIDDLVPVLRDHVAIIDAALSHSAYLAGDAFTLADISILPALHYLHQFPEGLAIGAAASNLSAYYSRLNDRPSAKATLPPPMP